MYALSRAPFAFCHLPRWSRETGYAANCGHCSGEYLLYIYIFSRALRHKGPLPKSDTVPVALQELAQLMQPLTRVASLLNTIPKIEPHPDNPCLNLAPAKFVGKIEFRNVAFTYPSERQKRVLHGLTFDIEPCTKVAFVGMAGCGKSTSVTLIQRFYSASSGTILLDGRSIVDYDVHHLRRNIGVVAQDNVLFSTSIYNNIVYGMGQGHLAVPSMEVVMAACDAANVTEFIDSFPNGIYTCIGEKGAKLSGGQKQRLAIARAIVRNPTILLLDEATSALDSVNENEVQLALDTMLKQHSGVAIVIAHRLTTIKNCDKIIVMEQGRKVEEGTHAELMAIDVVKSKPAPVPASAPSFTCTAAEPEITVAGFYHLMWDTQMGEETFADATLMSAEQLRGKLDYYREQVAWLEGVEQARKVDNTLESRCS